MLADVMRAARIDAGSLWLKYFSLGGEAGEYEVEAYVQGLMSLPVLQRDLLAMAANEITNYAPEGRAPYDDELNTDGADPETKPGPGPQDPPEPT